MEKYRGQYRVVCEFDRRNLEPIKEDNYIYCSNGGQIYRYNSNTLIYYRENGQVSKELLTKLDEAKVTYENKTVSGIEIYFSENDLNKTVDIFKIRTSGASYNPSSVRNLKLFKWFTDNEQWYKDNGFIAEKRELSDEEKQVLVERMKLAREKKNEQ
jgi:hypothetical protein